MTIELQARETRPATGTQQAAEDAYLDVSDFEEIGEPDLFRFVTKTRTFLFLVVIPSLLVAFYYAFWASDQYLTETRLIVRTIGISDQFDQSEERAGKSRIGGDSLTQDAYIVANYLESVDLVKELDKTIGLSQKFVNRDIDLLSRLDNDASTEDLHQFWLGQIKTYVDGPSGIIVFRVKAFTPEDAVTISKAALDASSRMMNNLSTRAIDGVYQRARLEVSQSYEAYSKALTDLRDYQNEVGIFNPETSLRITSTVISQLLEQKLTAEVQLASLDASGSSNSAQARQLRQTITALQDQIDTQQAKLTSQKETSGELSQQFTEFSHYETQRIVSEALYEAARRNLDVARSTVLRRSTFLSIFSTPHLPQDATHPKRLSTWFVISMGLLCLWAAGTLIWMSVEDHKH